MPAISAQTRCKTANSEARILTMWKDYSETCCTYNAIVRQHAVIRQPQEFKYFTWKTERFAGSPLSRHCEYISGRLYLHEISHLVIMN
jgi:hypothetical protein